MTADRPAGAVLCGGRSSRMGTDKAFVEVAGVAMAARVAAALDAAGCATVALVGGDAALLARIGRPLVPDQLPGEGPVGGVLSALDALDAELVVVASCDLPLLDGPAVGRLLDAAGADPAVAVAVATTDRPQQSLTCWRRALARPAIAACWDRGLRSLRDVIAAVPSIAVAVPPTAVRNVNTPAELSEAEASLGTLA